MKKLFTLSIFLLVSLVLTAQITGYEAKERDTLPARDEPAARSNVNMSIDQTEAHFPGGNDSLFRLIYSSLDFSDSPIEEDVHGEIMLSFYVNFDGAVSNVSVLQRVGHGVDEKVVEIIETLSFVPARMNETTFRSQVFYTVPISIRARR